MPEVKTFAGENPDVKKFVFEWPDAVAEAVLYKYGSYEKRTVLCVSTQSGCPVGCVFCGTGKNFIRNLTDEEIQYQASYVIKEVEKELDIDSLNTRTERLQIMFMSMGEPMLNIAHVVQAIGSLNFNYPNAELLISTIGVDNKQAWNQLFDISEKVDKVGLQCSVHATSDAERNELIPFKHKLDLRRLRDAGLAWNETTGRPVYLNFCIDSSKHFDTERVKDLFSPMVFNLTFSVVCETKQNQCSTDRDDTVTSMQTLQTNFISAGYNVRLFDPAGQDDIGGGCGQLWYVQDWFKQKSK